nr:HEPN domain-containing protein [Candidatus Njordarchaeota archaeon]
MARGYIKDAGLSLRQGKDFLKAKAYHRTVRASQEAVELATKATLRLLGIDYPKSHEVTSLLESPTVEKNSPKWFTESISRIREISIQLAGDRGPALYGDEKSSKPPEELYGREAAEEALKGARLVVGKCKRLIQQWRLSNEVEIQKKSKKNP